MYVSRVTWSSPGNIDYILMHYDRLGKSYVKQKWEYHSWQHAYSIHQNTNTKITYQGIFRYEF